MQNIPDPVAMAETSSSVVSEVELFGDFGDSWSTYYRLIY